MIVWLYSLVLEIRTGVGAFGGGMSSSGRMSTIGHESSDGTKQLVRSRPNRNGLIWRAIPGRRLRFFRLSRAKHRWHVFVWLDLRLFAVLLHVIVRIVSKVPLISLLNGWPVTPAL